MSRMFVAAILVSVLLLANLPTLAEAGPPNVVVILADDLGYGDVQCLNPAGKIPTPHLDKLAAQGMTFTDAHSGSAVCTPTRYGLLTGRYAWRSPLKSGVLYGYSPRLIEPNRQTIADVLGKAGYHTACIGKWHLGMDWPLKEGGIAKSAGDAKKVDYAQAIANGPTAVGFDQFFGISASLDMPPYIWIQDDHCVGLPTVEKTWIRKGPAHPDFEAIDVLPTLGKKAVEYVTERSNDEKPFFLYMPLASPHTPILPTDEWKGKSGLNAYADFVMQTDAVVGDVLAALEKAGTAENTLVIFTSDNGCSPQANFKELLAQGHNPSHIYRGHKADIFDGGHRVPFLVRWPGVVKPGSTTAGLACLTDIFRTAADAAGAAVPGTAGEDSVSLVGVLKGETKSTGRESVIHHSINGSFAIREGKWKLNMCPGSGGWSDPRPGRANLSEAEPVQLYDLSADPGEMMNLASQETETVARLTQLLERQAMSGRSTPGPESKNTTPVDVRKAGLNAMKPRKK